MRLGADYGIAFHGQEIERELDAMMLSKTALEEEYARNQEDLATLKQSYERVEQKLTEAEVCVCAFLGGMSWVGETLMCGEIRIT